MVHEQVDEPFPHPGQVLIKVEACGVNHMDHDLREGSSRIALELPHTLGAEFAGVVAVTGAGVTGVSEGDRVLVTRQRSCGCCTRTDGAFDAGAYGVRRPGGYAQYCRVEADSLVSLPEGVGFEAAAAYTSFASAHHMLVVKACVEPGEWVLVQAAGSAVGVMAVQMARLCGARVIAGVGSDWKLSKALALGADVAVNYSTDDITQAVRQATRGRGPDVVIDVVGGEVLLQSLNLVARGGRVVTCGAHAGENVRLDVVELFRNETQLMGSFAAARWEIERCLKLVQAGRLQAVIHRAYSLADVQQAFRELESRSNFGKVVLKPWN